MSSNLVSDAFMALSLHALDMQQTSKALGDREAEFVWHEVRAMMRSLAELKRSPLLDELNGRISRKPKEASYYYSRLAAIAAVFMVMKAQKWPRARACKGVGRLTGVDPNILEKKMGLPADVSDIEQIVSWEHWPDVRSILESSEEVAGRNVGRKPTRKEVFKVVIGLAKSNVESPEHTQWRRSMIVKAFRAKSRTETQHAFLIASRAMIERVTAEL